MFCPYKNSYLQLQTSVNPRLINKAVRRAMRKTQFDPHDEIPAAQRLTSMLPSLFAPWVDITRTRMGFERLGLRIVAKDITSEDNFIKVQAIHTLLDQVQISENAVFLIGLNVIYKLIKLLTDRDPILREKVCLILNYLTNYYQGRARMIAQPVIIDRLMFLFMRDRKEIRYAAALCFKNLVTNCPETILKNDKVIENLLKMIKNDHVGIVLLHLDSLKKLTDWDPVKPLKSNAFQVMMQLIANMEKRISLAALECLRQLCKHSVGQQLADKYDLMKVLLPFLDSDDIHIVISTVGLMAYASVTTKSKWRIKEFVYDLCRKLVILCLAHEIPVLQLRVMQILINLCDCPDTRAYIKLNFEEVFILSVKIRDPDQWDGTTESDNFGVMHGHRYRTLYKPKVSTVKNDSGDDVNSVSVAGYLKAAIDKKNHLLKIMNFEPHTA